MYDFSGFIFLLIMLPLIIVVVLNILLWLANSFLRLMDLLLKIDKKEE